jgi:hypothetical protein
MLHRGGLLGGSRAIFRRRDDEPDECGELMVNALVEATPISGPARVSNTRFDSLTIELSATLQMLKVER